MIRLLESAAGTLQSLLPPGRDVAGWHAALTAEIAAQLSPAHAALLARPDATATGTAWSADAVQRTRYADLSADGRRALDAALGAILSDIRRLAESGAAPAVRAAWPALREVPDFGHVFVADGRPVLAAWAHSNAGEPATGRLARLDDGVRWRAAARADWRRYSLALGVLAALALTSGLLLPMAYRWLVPAPAACRIVPGQLEAMRDQMALESRGDALRTLLASVTEELGRRQLMCPIAVAPPVAPPHPAPPPPPSPHADLPQDQWDRRELSMLEGCWNLESSMSLFSPDGSRSQSIKSWRLCFDGRGAGTQSVQVDAYGGCNGPLAATFQGELLKVSATRNCQGPTLLVARTEMLCRRASDTTAECEGHDLEGPQRAVGYTGRFRR